MPGEFLSRSTLSRTLPRLVLRQGIAPVAPAAHTPEERIPIGVRAMYGAIAVFAVWLIFSATSTTSMLEAAQAANEVMCGVLLVFFSTGAAFGLCRVTLVRHACTLTGVWLALSPLFLPGSFANASLFGGLATFGVAACAAEALEISGWR